MRVTPIGPQRLADFGQGLAALSRDLGDRMEDVVILTMSEFGRAVAENGNRGTDHGHGNAMFIVGGQNVNANPLSGGLISQLASVGRRVNPSIGQF